MPGRLWTKEKLIAEIKRLHAEGVDLSPTAIQKTHSALFSSARSGSHFGSWRDAIEAAGLDYDDLKRVKQRWSREEILLRIREMHTQGHDLLDPKFKIKNRSLYLAACAHRYFGSWRRAVEAAGLDHETMREGHIWTRTRILRTIQQLSQENKPSAGPTSKNTNLASTAPRAARKTSARGPQRSRRRASKTVPCADAARASSPASRPP